MDLGPEADVAPSRSGPAVDREGLLREALGMYSVRVLDNLDLSSVPSLEARLRLVGNALMDRGDARAFVLGRGLSDAAVGDVV